MKYDREKALDINAKARASSPPGCKEHQNISFYSKTRESEGKCTLKSNRADNISYHVRCASICAIWKIKDTNWKRTMNCTQSSKENALMGMTYLLLWEHYSSTNTHCRSTKILYIIFSGKVFFTPFFVSQCPPSGTFRKERWFFPPFHFLQIISSTVLLSVCRPHSHRPF